MNPREENFPESTHHGEAFKYFCEYCRAEYIDIGGQHSTEAWPVFLAGWRAKGKQHKVLRGLE